MAKQDKGWYCACGCGERKTSRKKKFAPGHSPKIKPGNWKLSALRLHAA
jgi:hypothetical protein